MRYTIFDSATVEKMKETGVICDYMKFTCQKCNSSWGIRLDPGRRLTEKDFMCKTCLFNEAVAE
jgi:hypothetical protein